MLCPKCGGTNVDVQTFQENRGGRTVSRTKSKYKEKGHDCLWWLIIGWWWWFIDLFIWIFAFFPRLIIRLFRKKKYVGTSTTVSSTKNRITYKSVCVCLDCGKRWER